MQTWYLASTLWTDAKTMVKDHNISASKRGCSGDHLPHS